MVVVNALGAAEIRVGSHRIIPASTRSFALLLYLAAERGRRVPRAALQTLVFPDQTEKNASHSLRQLVYKLRRDGAAIVSDVESVHLTSDDVASDYGSALTQDRLTLDQLRAVEGGFLPGYEPSGSEPFEEWLAAHRAKVA